MPTLIAKERFYYNGRNVEMGEEFEAEDADVALLTHHHTPKATTLELTPQKEPETKAQAKPRTTYKRRDMRAES